MLVTGGHGEWKCKILVFYHPLLNLTPCSNSCKSVGCEWMWVDGDFTVYKLRFPKDFFKPYRSRWQHSKPYGGYNEAEAEPGKPTDRQRNRWKENLLK